MKHILILTALATGAAAISHTSPCTSTLFNSEGSSCTDTLTDETITFSDFVENTTEASEITSTVDLGGATAGFTFTYFDGRSFFAPFSLGYTATITACATGFTCAITGYSDIITTNFPGAEVGVTATGIPLEPVGFDGDNYTEDDVVNLQSATKVGNFNGIAPMFAYESDVITSVIPKSSVPEPANISLFGAGLLSIALLRRRCAVRK